ncbi:MAG TPA: invasin domain 3-containing protein [Gemmatimonadales bacterium]|nr:invasin domain 3-containing protein [Gemmatimonadales bacterium]
MAVFSIALWGVTCRDNPVAPRGGGRAAFAVRPYIAQHIDLAGFGLTIDSLRLVVVHGTADTLRDTTAFFNPDSSQLHLNISLILSQPSESLKVSLVLSAGGVPLFTGTQTAVVSVGSSSSATPISIPMFFTGPGAGVTALHLSPVDSVLHFSDSLRFRVTADSAGIPVTNFYTAWRTSDTLAARVNAFGILHAPATRKKVYVVVRTYSGATDSTPVTFIPTPTLLTVQGGNGQTGTVGAALPGPLQVKVTAADGLGVKGIPVQFSILTGGGSLSAPQAITDTLGIASVTATLGTVAGPVSVQAASAGLTAVTFAGTVKPGLPTQLLANAGAGQSVAAGALLPIAPSVVAKDTFNNVVPGAVVTFSVVAGAGRITGATDTTNASGVATVGSWTLDTLAHVDSLVATLGTLNRVFTASGLAGAISTARSLITLVSDSVLSGTAGTITLRGRDQYGNALTSGGSVVTFTVSGGTSTGSLSAVTDHADGTYTATFTGTLVGTSDTVHATIGGVGVTSPLPLLRVVPGAVSLAQSVLLAAAAVDSSGLQDSVILTAKDQNGNAVTGPQTVVFSKSGGTSTGNLSGPVNLGGGKYGAVFTGILAGTPTTVSATVGGQSLTSTAPTIQVVPGAVSFASSVVTITQTSVAVGAHSVGTLFAKDAAGNQLAAGGLSVVFSFVGGTSGLSLGTPNAHDNGNGTYTDTLLALLPGTATAVHAAIGGTTVTSAAPSITVVLGNLITSQSVVTVDSATLSSGDSSVVHLQAKDSAGINLTVGGLTVVFFDSGGTSTGTVGPTTDHANGTYTAVFHGLLAGTATTMHATINGVTVSSTLPTVTVTPGTASPATSVVTGPVDSIASGAGVLFTIQLKDAAGNSLTTPGGTVVFSTIAGTSTGTFAPSPAAYAGSGTDTARFTGVLAGTRDSIKATINGNPVTTAKPTMLVFPGPASALASTVTVSDSVVAAGGIDTLRLTARDAAGNLLGKGGLTVAFSLSGGTSTGNIGATTDLGNGTYQAIFTGVNAGSAVSVGATIGGTPVSSALPTIRVNTTVHVANILADSTWTAVASPHVVHGYLKIANGATLTIQPGAVVKFDTASGLQVGDTAAGQAGGLSLAGTAAQRIALTVDSTAIRPGFWKGIEVQRLLAPTTWTHVLIEGAGGTRAFPTARSCLLSANNTGAALSVDSLHVRACQNDGIELWGGALTVRRSRVDTVSGAGIEALNGGTLTLDSTSVRGAGTLGLTMGPVGAVGPFLAGAFANTFVGNGTVAAAIQGLSLPHFGLQDSIAQNGFDAVVVSGGNPDSTVAAFTLVRQPPAATYEITGLLSIGSATGQTLTLDSNVVITFAAQSGLVIGDSAGTRQGLLKTLSTGTANGALLTGAVTGNPGYWTGLEFGRLAAPDTVVGLHIQYAGDSLGGYSSRRAGIWVRNPTASELVIRNAGLSVNGSTVSPNNAASIFISGSGGGVHIYGTNVSTSAGFGFAYQTPGVRLVGDTSLSSALSGLGIFVPPDVVLSSADSVANSRFSNSGAYSAVMGVGATPAIYPAPNAWTGNVRDTILLQGGAIVGQSVTVPRVPGVVWRALGPLAVSGGGTLTFAKGDTVAFDTSAAIIVGDTLNGPASLSAIAPDTAPILFSFTPGTGGHWHGITYLATPGDTSLRNVTVDGAGYFQPCFIIDCNGQPIGAIHVIGTPTANLVFDSITVRNSLYYAIQTNAPGSPGGVVVSHSQFYENRYFYIFSASHGPALTVDSSDIYAYHSSSGSSAILNSNGTFDSVVAVNNWWGDVAGPGRIAFGAPDSLGRTLLDTAQNGIAYAPFATAPYFPVGALAGVLPVGDSLLFCCNIQAGQPLPDSIRIRAVDVHLRGVAGQAVSWSAAPGSGTVLGSTPTDIGGRVGAIWTPTTVAKFDTAQASVSGITANLFLQVFPSTTASVHWQYIPSRTEAIVSTTLDSADFRAGGHVGAILTNAVDAFGNPVVPSTLYFDTLPGTGTPHNFGKITKITGDTIFFVDTADVIVPFQLHAVYAGAAGQIADSVIVQTNWVPVGVRIVPDTVAFNAICPIGNPVNPFCSRPVTAQLFDSLGNGMPANGQILFSWGAAGGALTVDSSGGPSIMTAFVTARDTGTATLTATQLTGPPLTPNVANATVIVRQIPAQVATTPDTISTGIGDTVTFHAVVADSGGTLLAVPPPIQWQIPAAFPGLVNLGSAGDSLRIRFDSGLYNFGTFNWVGVVNPFFQHVAGDTVFGQGTIFNPLVYNVVGSGTSISAQSRAAVDTVTNQTFYSSSINGVVYVNDNTTNGIVGGITTGGASPIWLTVSHAGGADKLYVSNNGSGTVTVIDPTTRGVSNTITLPQTTTPFGITAADPLGRVYVATRYCPGFPGLCTTEVAVMPIDVAGDSVVTADIVVLNTDSLRFPQGLAYNPNDQRLYVAMDSGYVKVVNPATNAEVGTILVQGGMTLTDVAVNPVTDTLYVSNWTGGGIAVIDPTTGTVVNSLPANTPQGISVDPVHNRIYYASSNNNTVNEIDGSTENFHTVIVGGSGDFPQAAATDPRTGTVYAPHFTALTVLQFYGKPVGQTLGAPPFRGTAPAAPVALQVPKRLTPMKQAAAPAAAVPAPARAKPAARTAIPAVKRLKTP